MPVPPILEIKHVRVTSFYALQWSLLSPFTHSALVSIGTNFADAAAGTPCTDGYPLMANGSRLWPGQRIYWKFGDGLGKLIIT